MATQFYIRHLWLAGHSRYVQLQ